MKYFYSSDNYFTDTERAGEAYDAVYTDEEFEKLYAAAGLFGYVGLKSGEKVPCVIPYDEETCRAVARRERESICFPVVNRGELWYKRLTVEQIQDLDEWYQAWLDITKTLVVPAKPDWLI
ncbi:MAG: hypothetical protein LUC24_03100 [Bacteroidales bacterium]|nr:hypothetical protein [Bacteroidales bacterium]